MVNFHTHCGGECSIGVGIQRLFTGSASDEVFDIAESFIYKTTYIHQIYPYEVAITELYDIICIYIVYETFSMMNSLSDLLNETWYTQLSVEFIYLYFDSSSVLFSSLMHEEAE
uniref:Uncharacterized protein n=1 Tax=Schistosoma curassoni TaxID=6186 RepID=A0A183KAY3_9TREM